MKYKKGQRVIVRAKGHRSDDCRITNGFKYKKGESIKTDSGVLIAKKDVVIYEVSDFPRVGIPEKDIYPYQEGFGTIDSMMVGLTKGVSTQPETVT